MKLKPLILVSLIFILISGFTACNRDNYGIPLVNVNIHLYTSNPQFADLNAVGGWVYITGGSKGIIVYRRAVDEFMAYDRHSPYEPENGCRVEVDSSNIKAVDPCSGSEFLLYDGSVITGPASLPLKPYQTTYDGNLLHIFN